MLLVSVLMAVLLPETGLETVCGVQVPPPGTPFDPDPIDRALLIAELLDLGGGVLGLGVVAGGLTLLRRSKGSALTWFASVPAGDGRLPRCARIRGAGDHVVRVV
jgi:hypothetical protein